MTVAEIIASILAGFGIIGTLVAWTLRTTVAPIRVAMDGSTKAVDRLISAIDRLDEKLDDHDGRLNRIETVHKMRRCDDGIDSHD